ncbi:MAG: hypothetical protein ACOY5F_01495 [Pseudomonadota bacterium]
MKDSETPEQPQEQPQQTEQTVSRAPFDSSDLNRIPPTTDQDPPYRDWWVVTDRDTQ